MSALGHMREITSLLEDRLTIDTALFGGTAGETLETKAALANARKVLDWFEGLTNRQNPYAERIMDKNPYVERIMDTGISAEKARQAFDKAARAVSTEQL